MTITEITESPTFERIREGLGLARRTQQDRAISLAVSAVVNAESIIVQAPTGVGKSLVALAIAADAGTPGCPGIVLTTTNSLGNQYLRDCQAAAQHGEFSYTRVMGRSHYVCADSAGGFQAQLPTIDTVDIEDDEAIERARRDRDGWLHGLIPSAADPACQYEYRMVELNDAYRCPGYPDCSGWLLGGCGVRHAREAAHHADVVISNFHVMAYAWHLDLPLLPLGAVLVIDEAHKLPEVFTEVTGGTLTPSTGSRVFKDHPALRDALTQGITACLDVAHGSYPGNSYWDTETQVPYIPHAFEAFSAAWSELPAAVKNSLQSTVPNVEETINSRAVLTLLSAFSSTDARQRVGAPWRAWCTRKQEHGQWVRDDTIYLRRVDAAQIAVPQIVGDRPAVLLSGTVGATLPIRLGLSASAVHDLGQVFPWHRVHGRISRYDGRKSGVNASRQRARDHHRLNELAAEIALHPGALVLANAHTDVRVIAEGLRPRLPGHRIYAATPGGGSLGADEIREQFVYRRRRGETAVLVGTTSFATGLDLPGELCTMVAWWCCVRPASGFYDTCVDRYYAGYGSYLDEQFRATFAQGIGRLLRTPEDYGEIMVCDVRAWDHLRNLGRIDAHLQLIQWRG